MNRVSPRPGATRRPLGAIILAVTAACALAAMMLLGACGVTTTQGIGGSEPQATATVTRAPATPTVAPTGTLAPGSVGCAAPKPGVTIPPASVTLPPRQATDTVVVRVGQTVGVDLPATFRWVLQRADPTHALTPLGAQGVLNQANKTCDWRFLAANAGRVTLSFTGVFQCPPRMMCPALAIDYTYTLDVRT